jgi:hypothetical protein
VKVWQKTGENAPGGFAPHAAESGAAAGEHGAAPAGSGAAPAAPAHH